MSDRSDPISSHPANATAAPAQEASKPDGGTAAELLDRLEPCLETLRVLATELEGEPEALLALLRRLEQLHRSIQDGPFRTSLPADRGALFQVLSEMERSGGWPYIPRLQLRTFLDLLGAEAAAEELRDDGLTPGHSKEHADHSPLAA
jgi:hypothetical protein